jgi:hypothetical protein
MAFPRIGHFGDLAGGQARASEEETVRLMEAAALEIADIFADDDVVRAFFRDRERNHVLPSDHRLDLGEWSPDKLSLDDWRSPKLRIGGRSPG